MAHNAQSFAGNFNGGSDFGRFISHQYNVCRFNGGVAAQRAHGDADIGACQHRRVVNAVAHKGKLAAVAALMQRFQQAFNMFNLIRRQKLRKGAVQPQAFGNFLPYCVAVARQHYGFTHTAGFKHFNGGGSVGFYFVLD